MKDLILIRHGESEHLVQGFTGGWTDMPLTARGQDQAAKLAGRLTDGWPAGPSALVSSDLRRASMTARILSDAVGLPVTLEPGLRELSNGAARGLRLEEAKAIERPVTSPTLDWIPYDEAESWRDMYRRVAACLHDLDAHVADCALVVSHGNALTCAVNWWLGLSDDRSLQDLMYRFDPTSVTHLRAADDGCRWIMRLNDTAHLA